MCFSQKYAIIFLTVTSAVFEFCSEEASPNWIEADDIIISYEKLWKLLIDRDMKKKDLEKAAGISNYVISKMTRNENITVETVGKICKALNCTPNDMLEFVSDSE